DLHGLLGNPDSAIADYTAVITMPDASKDHRRMALARTGWQHYLAGRYEQAVADMRQAISLELDTWNIHANLAVALLVLKQTDDALASYDRGLGLANLGNLGEIKKDLDEAIEKHGQLPG